MFRNLLVLVIFSAVVFFAEDLPLGVLQTARALHTNRDLLKTLPLYTCLETISRSRPTRHHRKPNGVDVVQVDVGVGGDREIYSWPGQSTFSPLDLIELVGHGFLSTGLFHSFASNLFVFGHGIVKLASEEEINGTPALHFTYTTPSLENRWNINWRGAQGSAGQQGDFWVDSANYTLLRLTVRAENISASLPLKALTTTIDYQPLTLYGKPALLPRQARVIAVENNGDVLRNDAAFSHCHVFEAESRVAKAPADLGNVFARYETSRSILPAGLTFTISLQTPILARSVRIGDAIEARLEKQLKLSTEIIAPQGALLSGHVREFDKLDDPPNTSVVALEFDLLQWPGHSYSFLAEVVGMQQLAGLHDKIYRGASTSRDSGAGMLYSSTTETFWPTAVPGTATFMLQNAGELPRGFRMTWRTKKLTAPQ